MHITDTALIPIPFTFRSEIILSDPKYMEKGEIYSLKNLNYVFYGFMNSIDKIVGIYDILILLCFVN